MNYKEFKICMNRIDNILKSANISDDSVSIHIDGDGKHYDITYPNIIIKVDNDILSDNDPDDKSYINTDIIIPIDLRKIGS